MSNEESRGTSRSGFLKQAAGATIVVAGASAGAGVLAGPAAAAFGSKKGYDKFLELDGVNVGRLVDASGGDQAFSVVIADYDADGNPDKVLGPPIRTPFTIEFGVGVGKPMIDWIRGSFADPSVRKDGAIIVADFDRNEVARRSFTGGWITSFSTPPLQNRPQAFPAMTLTFEADSVSDDTPSGAAVVGAKQKAWLCSNFRFDCKGLPANRVASIDSFTWARSQPPGSRAVLDNPSDVVVLLDSAAAPAWMQWYDNFALGGDSSDERDATLTVYSQVPQVPLFTWTFKRLGINTIKPDGPLGRLTAEMYCEAASWDLGKQKKA